VTSLQTRAGRMAAEAGFLGVPLADFETGGRLQLEALQHLGLRPEMTVLGLGCGCPRAGYWLIHFLDPGHYCGIEPRRDRVELGLRHLLEPGVVEAKRPRFDHNQEFDSSVFGMRFHFFLARSIWSHAAKPQISGMLDGFVRDGRPSGVFLASYLPAGPGRPDYQGASWVGTSHESDQPGVVYHDARWVREQCHARGLSVDPLGRFDFGGQTWLLIRAPSPP